MVTLFPGYEKILELSFNGVVVIELQGLPRKFAACPCSVYKKRGHCRFDNR
ncbi:MAG: hypothetical protein ACI92E_002020 [Oceanicoccus sp.]|jgi:hypothetical protein